MTVRGFWDCVCGLAASVIVVFLANSLIGLHSRVAVIGLQESGV